MPNESKGKKSKGKKEAQLLIRLDKDLRDKFVAACQDVDTSASREIRCFMRSYLARYVTVGRSNERHTVSRAIEAMISAA